jgi:tetratricopeptide (TPR) repeat protein
MGRVCTVLVNTDHQVSRLHGNALANVGMVGNHKTEGSPMSLGVVTEMSKGAEPEHMIEFREGVELLKNEYPEKALVKLRRAFESDKHNPYYISFLGLSIARAEQKFDQASELCETAVKLKRTEIQFHLNLVAVYALAGLRDKALHKLDGALRVFGDDARLRRARNKVVTRQAPVLPFLERSHFLNRELGKLRHRVMKRFDK